ncbi:MAG TPA: EamA family transporter, partial [Trueperaceae bacterium]|nr:EamA family transporter [Trueperaceae bacterium]
ELALAGLMFVLDVFGAIEIDLIGAAWGVIAAACLASYFIVSADDSHGLSPLVLATGGLIVAAVVLLLAGATGLVSMYWTATGVDLAGATLPWWAVVAALGLVAAAFAYAAGVAANRRLGSKVASFVGLSEVLFAVLWAWLLLGELPAVVQLLGGLLILAGVIVVRLDEREPTPTTVKASGDAATAPVK